MVRLEFFVLSYFTIKGAINKKNTFAVIKMTATSK